MILSSAMTMPMKSPVLEVTRKNGKLVMLASMSMGGIRTDTEQLRKQIDQLNHEAEITRSKANNARVRLMRLSQAAENLQQWAAMDVALSKENEARELLMQKKKLMQALERTKRRLEVLDELSLKINEAISLKETQLIGHVSFFPEITRENSSQEIRIISPKNNSDKDTMKSGINNPQNAKFCDEQDEDTGEHETGLPLNHELDITRAGEGMISDLRAISSYEDFLEDVDDQLQQVEIDIGNFLRFSTMVLESEQKQMNPKVQQASEILQHVCSTRDRIASFMKRRGNSS